MYKSIGLSTLAGGITLFLLGGLFYAGILAEFFAGQTTAAGTAVMKDPPNMLGIAVSNLALALMLAIVFYRWANISTFQTGAIAGGVITFLMALSFDIMMLSTADMMTPLAAVVDIVIYTVMGAVAGGVIGLILGRVKAT